jgi:hypothetical protein
MYAEYLGFVIKRSGSAMIDKSGNPDRLEDRIMEKGG